MKPDHILVRFGELTTKGKNRKLFIRKLLKNTKEILHDYSALEYELTYDRLYIYLNEENAEEVTDKLKTIFGIHNFSLCYKVEHDLEKAKEVVTYIIDHDEGNTFKIDTKRHDKSYPKTSIEMNKEIAGYVFHHTTKELSVDVDCMIVIGGKHSSNTQKLVNICKEQVPTFAIETKEDLDIDKLNKFNLIGVTAGASTPDWIIEDVISFIESL